MLGSLDTSCTAFKNSSNCFIFSTQARCFWCLDATLKCTTFTWFCTQRCLKMVILAKFLGFTKSTFIHSISGIMALSEPKSDSATVPPGKTPMGSLSFCTGNRHFQVWICGGGGGNLNSLSRDPAGMHSSPWSTAPAWSTMLTTQEQGLSRSPEWFSYPEFVFF